MDKFLSICYGVLYRSILVRKPIVLYFIFLGGIYEKNNGYNSCSGIIFSASINVNIKMYIFDHLRMYKFAHSSSCIIYSLKRYDFPVMFMTCA